MNGKGLIVHEKETQLLSMKVGEKKKSVLIFQKFSDSLKNTWKIIGCVCFPSQCIISQSAVKPKHVCLHRKAVTPSVSHRSDEKNTTAATSTPVTSCNSSSCLTSKGVSMLQFVLLLCRSYKKADWQSHPKAGRGLDGQRFESDPANHARSTASPPYEICTSAKKSQTS